MTACARYCTLAARQANTTRGVMGRNVVTSCAAPDVDSPTSADGFIRLPVFYDRVDHQNYFTCSDIVEIAAASTPRWTRRALFEQRARPRTSATIASPITPATGHHENIAELMSGECGSRVSRSTALSGAQRRDRLSMRAPRRPRRRHAAFEATARFHRGLKPCSRVIVNGVLNLSNRTMTDASAHAQIQRPSQLNRPQSTAPKLPSRRDIPGKVRTHSTGQSMRDTSKTRRPYPPVRSVNRPHLSSLSLLGSRPQLATLRHDG